MPTTPLDPDVADAAPSDSILTAYDEQHLTTYLRLFDAKADGAQPSVSTSVWGHILT
jgi:hypothetical protein